MDWSAILMVVLKAILGALDDKTEAGVRECLVSGDRLARLRVLREVRKEIGRKAYRQNRREVVNTIMVKVTAKKAKELIAAAKELDE
jgi:hypothetical protein